MQKKTWILSAKFVLSEEIFSLNFRTFYGQKQAVKKRNSGICFFFFSHRTIMKMTVDKSGVELSQIVEM
jgi:hypothetical protein